MDILIPQRNSEVNTFDEKMLLSESIDAIMRHIRAVMLTTD